MEVEEFNKGVTANSTPETEEERKEKIDKFLRSALIIKHKNILQDINRYMTLNGLNLEQLRQEIVDKKCRLNASRRNFILSFKLDFIQQLFNDIEEKKNGIN